MGSVYDDMQVMAVALKAVDVWLFDVSYGERTMPAFVILILIVFTGLFVYSAAVLGSGAIKLSELKTYMKRK